MDKSAALLQRIESLSPEKQALLLRKLATQQRVDDDAILPRADRTAPAPLSHSQELLWLVEQREGASAKYNMPCAYQLRGALDVAALVATFKTIARRHDSFRTWFAEVDGEARQCVDPHRELDVPVHDLAGLPADAREARVRELVQENIDWRFDVARPPLARIQIVRTAADEHYLLMNLHHIVYDGWSKGLLLKEMAVLYPAYAAGERDAERGLPTLTIQYGDYAAWQRGGRRGGVERQLDYWRGKLAGSLPLLDIPGDRPRPAMPSGQGAGLLMHVPKFLTEKIDALGRGEGASTYMAMLAAFNVLLARLSGQRDIVLGTPVDNRDRDELQHVIGYFLNTSVLRNDVDPALSFRALLGRVKQTCLEAYQNQDAALGQIIDAVNPQRSLAYSPLFQVMFVFQNAGSANFVMPGIEIDRADAENSTSKYDLYLSFQDTADGLKGWWTYNTDLYDQATIEYYSRCLLNLLLDCVADPDKPVGRLRLHDATDVAATTTTTAVAPFRPLGDAFVERALATPDATALVDDGAVVTYAQLHRRAGSIAAELTARGVGRGDVVVVLAERSAEQVAALVALALRGAACLALDPTLPAARLQHLVGDARPRVVVGDARHAAALADMPVPFVGFDAIPDAPAPAPVALLPDDILYLLYTSGSTGTPKGVRGTHGATWNRLAWMWDAHPWRDGDVACIKTTVNFVDAIAELWSPLLAGVPALLVRSDEVRDVYTFVRKLARHGVTRLVAVPSFLRALIEAYPELGETLPALRHVVSSGEALTADLAGGLRDALPDLALLNLYGSTEIAADATCEVVEADPAPGQPVPVGRPIANLLCHVFDGALQRCATGAPGELYVGGAGVNDGYHAQPALTAERFLPDPYAATPGARMFRSGDLARARRDGRIELLGRRDHQVKLRGVRIELDEIRAALLAEADVADACVVFKLDADVGDYVGAYLVAREDREINVSRIGTRLRERLPDYLVPGAFAVLDALPLNANGKIDLFALPPFVRAAERQAAYVAPAGEVECELAQIWQERLKVERIGAEDNFFDLGGHSLVAARIVAAVRERFGVEATARELFATMTVRAFAERIDALRAARRAAADAEAAAEADFDVVEY